jgi:hypothetical protein
MCCCGSLLFIGNIWYNYIFCLNTRQVVAAIIEDSSGLIVVCRLILRSIVMINDLYYYEVQRLMIYYCDRVLIDG